MRKAARRKLRLMELRILPLRTSIHFCVGMSVLLEASGLSGGADGAPSSSLLRDTSAGAARCLVTGCLGHSQLSGAPKRCKLSTALPVDRSYQVGLPLTAPSSHSSLEHATVSAGQYPTTILDYPHNLVLVSLLTSGLAPVNRPPHKDICCT